MGVSLCVEGKNVEVDVRDVVDGAFVVRVALHHHGGDVARLQQFYSAIHIRQVCGSRRDDDGLSFGCYVVKLLCPVDIAGPDFVSVHEGIEVVDCLEVIRGGHELDPDGIGVGSQLRGPLPRQARILIDLEDRLGP